MHRAQFTKLNWDLANSVVIIGPNLADLNFAHYHFILFHFVDFNQIRLFWLVKIIKEICTHLFIYSPSNFVPNGIHFWYFLLKKTNSQVMNKQIDRFSIREKNVKNPFNCIINSYTPDTISNNIIETESNWSILSMLVD